MKDLVHAVKSKHLSNFDFRDQKMKDQRAANAGKFRAQIQNERKNRLSSVQNPVDQRMNRFGGMIVRKTTVSAESNSSSVKTIDEKDAKHSVTILKRSLTGHTAAGGSNKGTVSSQINKTSLGGGGKKRGKKCSFADASTASSSMQSINNIGVSASSSSVNVLQASMKSNMQGGLGDEERHVNMDLAEFLDDFLEFSFGELVFSMKNGWRRADANTPQRDLLFYHLTTACLQYERFLQLDRQRTHVAAREKGETSEPWVPVLTNITQCFDRMMISHPADTVKKHFEMGKGMSALKAKTCGDIIVPMALYKETISFLRIMLESEETTHNDIAMTALYRIFFNPTTTDCLDILPVLLRNWNPRSFSKSHMVALIELCHETLKLLDIADTYVRAEEKAEAKLSRKQLKALEGRDLNFAAAKMFNKDQYFLRITSNTTVAMYTKALEFYRENTPQLNHYIYVYFKRMKEHVLETEEGNDEDSSGSEDQGDHGLSEAEKKKKRDAKKLNLGHMLFNIGTLNTFSIILNDHDNNKNIEVFCYFFSISVDYAILYCPVL
jgi:hypothetical protein